MSIAESGVVEPLSEPVSGRPVAAMPGVLHRLRDDKRGATIIEFAIISAPFLALLLGVAQTTLTMFTQQALETTAEQASRQVRTGAVQKANLSKSAFRTMVCGRLSHFMKCANLMVDIRTTTGLEDIDAGNPVLTYDGSGNVSNNWQYTPGGPGDVVVMRTMYQLPVVTGPLGFDLSNMRGGKRLLIATSVFKNETY